MEIASLYVPFPNEQSAIAVIEKLLEKNQIACANLIPAGQSFYRWEGKIVSESEVYVIFKAVRNSIDTLTENLKKLHPYETPAILSLNCESLNVDYSNWLYEQVSPK